MSVIEERINRLQARSDAAYAALQRARKEDVTIHACAHCGASCKVVYTFCYRCMQSLPKPLRDEITRNTAYGRNRRGDDYYRRQHWAGISEALEYLAASDPMAFTWRRANAGEHWAIAALLENGELDHAGQMRILRRNAAKREQANEAVF